MMLADVYFFSDSFYFVSKATLENGPIISIEPILTASVKMDDEEIGHCLMASLQSSTTLKEKPADITSAFKKLLKISKAKTNKKLVAEAQLIQARLSGQQLELEQFESNVKYKCFVRGKVPVYEKLDILNVDTKKMGEFLRKISLNA